MNKQPDPNTRYPVPGENGQDPYDVTYIKPTVTRPNIIVGDLKWVKCEIERRIDL